MLQTLNTTDRLDSAHFCYWLQGLLEDARLQTLDAVQVQMIREHLALVFHHVTLPPPPVITTTTQPYPSLAQTISEWQNPLDSRVPRTVMIC